MNAVDDEALKHIDWKPAVGKYLVKAKYTAIKFLEDKTEITDRKQLEHLEGELLQLSQDTDVRHIPAYSPIPRQKLIMNIESMTKATSLLIPEDKIIYLTPDEKVSFNLSFNIVPESIEELITRETIISSSEMILKVKKPDYLGESKWDFQHENKIRQVKILDEKWLHSFQNREIDIRPGDCVRAKVEIITKYGYDYNVVTTLYNISEVIEIIPFSSQDQTSFLT